MTLDVGANPSFKIRKVTGDWTWRSANATFKIYGTNNISAVNDTTFSNTNLTEIYSVSNPAAEMDSGYWTGDFYRYYVIYLNGTGNYDWGLDNFLWYGDYY